MDPNAHSCISGLFGPTVGLCLAACDARSPARDNRACAQPGPSGTTRALLVGVSDYQPSAPGDWPSLRSDADLSRMRSTLGALGVSHMCVLHDEEADAEGILDGLQEVLLPAVQPGDHLLFYFAGHGTSVPDTDGDEADGRDEALAPHGALKGQPDGLLVDDTLAPVWARLRAAAGSAGSLVAVVDACHSGTITRGASPNGGSMGTGPWLDRGAANSAPFVLFSGADDRGRATETATGGRLTTAWTHAVLASHQPRSWGQIAAEVNLQISMVAAGQRPVFSGPPDLGMFGGPGDASTLWAVHAVDAPDRVTLRAGALHGLRRGDQVDADGLTGTVEAITPTTARVVLESPGKPAHLLRTRFASTKAREHATLDPGEWRDAEVAVRLTRTHRDAACRPTADPRDVLVVGERFGLELTHTGTLPAWVAVALTDSTGRTVPLWPTSASAGSLLHPGQTWDVPLCLEATEPAGIDRVHVFATDSPVNPHGLLGWTTRDAAAPSTRGWHTTIDVPVKLSRSPTPRPSVPPDPAPVPRTDPHPPMQSPAPPLR